MRSSNIFVTFASTKIFVMRINELIKALKDAGCSILRHGSRYDLWFSPLTNRNFAVPRHSSKELPTGTEKSIRKQAGI